MHHRGVVESLLPYSLLHAGGDVVKDVSEVFRRLSGSFFAQNCNHQVAASRGLMNKVDLGGVLEPLDFV
eukprot:CAMPEP_0184313286 /NCGR_PEP_ID=MMETSP1049-20130417/61387_1 /TAXON_ID=77928 /ORGANISM="Proteomonas sulcata, Strain CCMP704" /LENGTH=68 /DNA_ID=CAMNT_0026630345 /DNA_START=561 /DNA_END=764 /DNA_ORIENTATION=+